MMSDHNQSMQSCLAIYDEALRTPGIFSPKANKRRNTDLRHLGEHPELYSLALTRVMQDFLKRYMSGVEAARASRLAHPNEPKSKYSEESVLDSIIPGRGWTIITGRRWNDVQSDDDPVTLDDIVFDASGEAALADEETSGLKDEFPDDADYSAWGDSVKTKLSTAAKPASLALTPRQSARMNTLTAERTSSSYGKVIERFLLAQTPSLDAIATEEFEKTKEAHSNLKEKNETEKGETSNATATHNASLSTTTDGDPLSSSIDDRFPPPALRRSSLNEGMLIVRRPVIHFWLRCHSFILWWHRDIEFRRRVIAAALKRAKNGTARDRQVAEENAKFVNEPFQPPPPHFLTRHQQAGWWKRLVQAVQLQHGIARAQSSREFEESKEQEANQREMNKYHRGYRGTKRDGTKVEPQLKSSVDESRTVKPQPNWNIRTRGAPSASRW